VIGDLIPEGSRKIAGVSEPQAKMMRRPPETSKLSKVRGRPHLLNFSNYRGRPWQLLPLLSIIETARNCYSEISVRPQPFTNVFKNFTAPLTRKTKSPPKHGGVSRSSFEIKLDLMTSATRGMVTSTIPMG
jgi:hypothetical protein